MANKDVHIEEDIIDLTELIESGDRGDGRAPQQGSPQAEDDFSSILADTADGANENFDPDEQLDMSGMGGIDNLLESLDIPPQPRAGAKQAAPPAGDEIDSVLDDLLGEATPKQTASAMPELDMPPPQAAPASPTPPAAPASSGLDADLDDLLSSFDEPAPKKKAPAAEAPDLDDILNEAPKSSAATKQAPVADSDLDDLLGEAPRTPAAKTVPSVHEDPGLAADLDDILGEVELPAPPKPAPPSPEKVQMPPAEEAAEAAPAPETAEDLLQDITVEQEAAAPQEPDLSEEQEHEAAPSDNSSQPATENSDLDDLEVPDELYDLPESSAISKPAGADLPSHMPPPGPAITTAPQGNEPVPVQTIAWTPETLVGICRNIASGEGTQQSLQKFSRELGQQTAHVEDMGEQLSQLGKRVLACESKLSAARARIASLEKSLESTAAFEDLLREGTPLHTGFMALISAAVSNSLKGFALPGADTAIQKHVARLEASVEHADKRIKALEERLDQLSQSLPQGETDLEEEIAKLITDNENSDLRIRALEKKVNALADASGEQMEKTVAAMVARILQEEISRLIQE